MGFVACRPCLPFSAPYFALANNSSAQKTGPPLNGMALFFVQMNTTPLVLTAAKAIAQRQTAHDVQVEQQVAIIVPVVDFVDERTTGAESKFKNDVLSRHPFLADQQTNGKALAVQLVAVVFPVARVESGVSADVKTVDAAVRVKKVFERSACVNGIVFPVFSSQGIVPTGESDKGLQAGAVAQAEFG